MIGLGNRFRSDDGVGVVGVVVAEELRKRNLPAFVEVIDGGMDKVFAAGAHRVACDIEVWDEDLARRICPGKARFAGRER